jgi:lysozyme
MSTKNIKAMNSINKATIDLIKHFESLHDGDSTMIGLQPKMDPIGIWTEGWGRAMIDPLTKQFLKGSANKSRALALQTIHNIEEADSALLYDLNIFAKETNAFLQRMGAKLSDNQYGALLSLAYNAGAQAMQKTYGRVIAAISDEDIYNAFGLYCKARVDGKLIVLNGLVARRKAEAKLALTK